MIRRLRKFILITGTLLCVMVAVLFVVSAWWQVAIQVPTSRGPAMYVAAGSALFASDEMRFFPASAERHSWGLSQWNRWTIERSGVQPGPRGPVAVTYLAFPLWLPLAVALLATLLAWRFWPKPVKPGHCRCGYDLHGNESGVCPECGIGVQR